MSKEKQSEEKKPAAITRRDFLKGIAVGAVVTGAVATGVAAVSWPVAPPPVTKTETTTTTATTTMVKEVPPPKLKLTVNGRAYEFTIGDEVEPNWTLHYVLHDVLGITSVKEMCTGRGECGSCTVIMDGRPILSCMALAIECDGKKIETVEGIAAAKHPIIGSWVDFDGMQCGYCTPGAIVTAKALLDRKPNPTKEEILDFLSGNICVCGTYPQWPKAVLDAVEKLKGGK